MRNGCGILSALLVAAPVFPQYYTTSMAYTFNGNGSDPYKTAVTDIRGVTDYNFNYSVYPARSWPHGLISSMQRKNLSQTTVYQGPVHNQDTVYDNQNITVRGNPTSVRRKPIGEGRFLTAASGYDMTATWYRRRMRKTIRRRGRSGVRRTTCCRATRSPLARFEISKIFSGRRIGKYFFNHRQKIMHSASIVSSESFLELNQGCRIAFAVGHARHSSRSRYSLWSPESTGWPETLL